jgi:hypothetical protein
MRIIAQAHEMRAGFHIHPQECAAVWYHCLHMAIHLGPPAGMKGLGNHDSIFDVGTYMKPDLSAILSQEIRGTS